MRSLEFLQTGLLMIVIKNGSTLNCFHSIISFITHSSFGTCSQARSVRREARASGGDAASDQIKQRMEAAMTRYLTIKAALLEPETLRLMMEMTSATCDVLVQAALAGDKAELGPAFRGAIQ